MKRSGKTVDRVGGLQCHLCKFGPRLLLQVLSRSEVYDQGSTKAKENNKLALLVHNHEILHDPWLENLPSMGPTLCLVNMRRTLFGDELRQSEKFPTQMEDSMQEKSKVPPKILSIVG
jgi:hypothetical protein